MPIPRVPRTLLLLGAAIGWVGLLKWPGRVVEVALAALAAGLVLGGLV